MRSWPSRSPAVWSERDRDRVVALVPSTSSAAELVAVVGPDARGGVRRELGEVVEHARLVDDQVRELADAGRVVVGARRTHDARRLGRVGLPERHLGDAVRLGDDALGETERLEGLDAARLDAVGLADLEATAAALDDAGRHAGELRELRRGDHAGRARPDDEHIDLVGKLVRSIDADARGRLQPRVTGHVAVVVELHGFSSLLCGYAYLCATDVIARVR